VQGERGRILIWKKRRTRNAGVGLNRTKEGLIPTAERSKKAGKIDMTM